MHRSVLLTAGFVLAALALGSAPAYADREWGHHRHGYEGGRGYGNGYYAPPPVYYAPPPAYYAPPPVYYAPPPVYFAPPVMGLSVVVPGVAIGLGLPLR